MQKRQLTIVGIVLIAVTILFAITTYRQQAQDKSQPQQDEATVVKKGQVTDKEREHSKEYKKLYSYRNGRKLTEPRIPRGGTEDFSVFIDIPHTAQLTKMPSITASEFLRDLSCNADAIVVGSVKSKVAHLFEDETFVYTEYEFLVQDILKNNSASPIKAYNHIEVTRPGGIIKLDNRRIKVEDFSYAPLQKNKEYLLFIRYVPSTNDYVVASPKGDFLLENNSFKALGRRSLPEDLRSGDNYQSLLKDVRSSVSAGCNQNSLGGN